MLIKIEKSNYGFIAYPVSTKTKNIIKNNLVKNFNVKSDGTCFFQNLENLLDNLGDYLSRFAKKDLQNGYTIKCRLDSWFFLHCYDYDSNILV